MDLTVILFCVITVLSSMLFYFIGIVSGLRRLFTGLLEMVEDLIEKMEEEE